MVTVTGGKLTTYRKMAEDTVDAVVKVLGRRPIPCVTKDLRLHGAGPGGHAPARAAGIGPGEPADGAAGADGKAGAATGPATATVLARHLAGRYGTGTPEVLSLADGHPELLDPLVPGLHYLGVEARYAVREEMAGTVADILDRRTRASLRDARGAAEAALKVATLIGPDLGWSRDRITAEATAYAEALRAQLTRAGLDARSGPYDPDSTDVADVADGAVASGAGTSEHR
jgi:glycerol-3-phosphate dehydrogenase